MGIDNEMTRWHIYVGVISNTDIICNIVTLWWNTSLNYWYIFDAL